MERAAFELAQGLLDRGYELTVIARECLLPPRPTLRFVRIRGPLRPFLANYLGFALIAGFSLLRHRRGVLHTIGAIVPQGVDVVTVQYCHRASTRAARPASTADSPLHRLNNVLARVVALAGEVWCYRAGRIRACVPVSTGVRTELERGYPRCDWRLTTIPNGVDTTRFHPRADTDVEDDRDLVAAFVGGDWVRKGLAHAICALRHAPGWSLIVVGDGDPAEYLKLARANGVSDRVRFAGPSDAPEDELRAADAFVFPSAYEAFPLVGLEAAASGLPLLATPVNGMTELITDGNNGWLLPRDSAAIGAKLTLLGADAQLRKTMARAARMSAEPFGWSAIVDAYCDLYAMLVRADA